MRSKIVKCIKCNKSIKRSFSQIKRVKFIACSKSCASFVRMVGKIPWNKGRKLHYDVWNKGKENFKIRLENHPYWKGGRVKMSNGYIRQRTQNKSYMLEHRLIMEGILDRKLSPGEVVHHIDHNRSNNSPDNLRVFASNSEHIKYHHDRR